MTNSRKQPTTWRTGMQIEREPYPDAEVEEALRLFERARARAAQKSGRQNQQRGAGGDLLVVINSLQKLSIARDWHRDKATQLVAAISLHENKDERTAALNALAGLTDALDGIHTLQRMAGLAVAQHLQQKRGPTKDVALQQLVNRLAALFEERTGKRATIINDINTSVPGGWFLTAAMEAISYLPNNIAPTESEVVARTRARIDKAQKVEPRTRKG